MNVSVATTAARLLVGRNLGLFLLLVVELALVSLLVPGYFSLYGLLDASRQFAEVGLVAVGMTLVIITGGIDLSVGALLALVSVTIGFVSQAGAPLPVAILCSICVGAAGGCFNGFMITSLRLHPLVVTLSTFALFRGIAFAVSGGDAVSTFPPWFGVFGQVSLFNLVPVQLICFVATAFAFALVLARTSFGRRVYALGNNELACRFSGVNTGRTKLAVYTLVGCLVGLAGVIYTSRISSARANAGYGLELTVIAMVVLGGAKITGGSGTVWGTVLGVLVLSYLQDGLTYAGVRGDWALVVTGAFLIIAVLLNQRFGRVRIEGE